MQIYLYFQPFVLENHIESIDHFQYATRCVCDPSHRITVSKIVGIRKFRVDADIAILNEINLSPWHIMIPSSATYASNLRVP